MKKIAIAAGLALAACKGDGPGKGKGEAPAAPPAAPPAPVAVDAAAAAPVDPPEPPATVAAGAVELGCFAWSPKLQAVACITGSQRALDAELELLYLGAPSPGLTFAALDDASASAANAALAGGGFTRFPGPGTELVDGKRLELAGVGLTWKRTVVVPAGENQPPTGKNVVTLHCGGKDVVLHDDEVEGDLPTVSVRAVGARLVVETRIAYGREGEYGADLSLALIDPTTCAIDDRVE